MINLDMINMCTSGLIMYAVVIVNNLKSDLFIRFNIICWKKSSPVLITVSTNHCWVPDTFSEISHYGVSYMELLEGRCQVS